MTLVCATAFLLLGNGLPQVPAVERVVSFEAYGAVLSTFVGDLQAKVGERFEVDSELAGEPILLNVKDCRTADLMRWAASAVGGTWFERKPGVHTLELPPAVREAQWLEHAQKVKLQIQPAIDSLVAHANLDLSADLDSFRALLERRKAVLEQNPAIVDGRLMPGPAKARAELDQGLPAGRAIARLIKLIPMDAIASLMPDSRIVYSTAPTKMERPLGPAAAEIIKTLNEEETSFVRAAQANPASLGASVERPASPLGSEGESDPPRPKLPVARILLIVRHTFGAGALEVLIAGIDKTGGIPINFGVMLDNFQPTSKAAPLVFASDEPIVLSEQARAYMAGLVRRFSASRELPEPSADLLALYLAPEQHEPLWYAAGEGLAKSAAANGLGLVGSCRDLVMLDVPGLPAEAKAKDWLNLALKQHSLRKDDGVLVVTPRDRWLARYQRTPRPAIGAYLRSVAHSKVPSLDDRAALAHAINVENVWSIAEFIAHAVGYNFWTQNESHRLLKFYGSLSEAQRRTLRDGGAVRVSDLGRDASMCLSGLLYDSAGSSLVQERPTGGAGRYLPVFLHSDKDPDEWIGDGLPSGANIRLVSDAAAAAYYLNDTPGNSPLMQMLPAAAMGAIQAQIEVRPDLGVMKLPESFWCGTDLGMVMRISFGEHAYAEYRLSSAELDLNGKQVSLKKAPEEFRFAFEAAYANAKKNLSEAPTRPPGVGTRKPPP